MSGLWTSNMHSNRSTPNCITKNNSNIYNILQLDVDLFLCKKLVHNPLIHYYGEILVATSTYVLFIRVWRGAKRAIVLIASLRIRHISDPVTLTIIESVVYLRVSVSGLDWPAVGDGVDCFPLLQQSRLLGRQENVSFEVVFVHVFQISFNVGLFAEIWNKW